MIIQNAIKIMENYPEETFLVSLHRHDYQKYTFKSGEFVTVDGGNDYIRRGSSTKSNYGTDWMEWIVDDKIPFDIIKSMLLWGTKGKKGDMPTHFVLLKNCETSHLKNILKTQKNISDLYKKVIKSILKDRENKNESNL